MERVKKSLSCAFIEYTKWILDSRMIIIAVLLVFIYSFVITPLLDNAMLMGNEPLNLFEPFIAVANSGLVLLILPLTFMVLIADFPKIDNSTVFYIHRTGRVQWLIGQLLKLVMMVLSFLLVIFLGSVIPVLTNSYIGDNWSKVVLEFALAFPEKSGNFGVQLLPENLYNQMKISEAAVQSYLLIFAYLMIIGLILLFFSVIKRKTMGFVICGTVIALGTAFCSIKTELMWTMPMANSIIWLHYTKYLRKPIMPMWFSVLYLCFFIILLIVLSFIAVKKMNYDNISEVTA